MKTLVISICLAITLTQLQPASPRSGKGKGNPPQKQTQAARDQAAANQRGTEQSPIVVKVLPTPKTNEETVQEQQNRQDQSSANWWMVKLTFAIGLITLVQLFVFGLQARRLRQTILKMEEIANSQGEDMKASIAQAVRSAAAMERVAADMAISSKAATESVATLKERTAQQMRAYLTVIIGTGVYQERNKNVKFSGNPTLINTGHTPARNVGYRASAAILPIDLPETFTFPLPTKAIGASVIGPQQSNVIGAVVESFVPDQDVKVIKSGIGHTALYVWGVVTYEDVFGEPHQTEFCQMLTWLGDEKQTVFGFYTPRHNDVT